VGEPDPNLTPVGGLEAVREVDRVLGVTAALDAGIGAVKQRDRGLTGGQLLMSLAACQLTGGDHLVSLDRRREDVAGERLAPVPPPAPTTATGIARRFGPSHLHGMSLSRALCK
jgi:hypothetical protein